MNKEQAAQIRKQIGKRLKEARNALNYTQEEAAGLLNSTQWYVSRIENGSRRIDIAELIELANIYEIDLDDLIAQ